MQDELPEAEIPAVLHDSELDDWLTDRPWTSRWGTGGEQQMYSEATR